MPKKVKKQTAIYIRVSTKDQNERLQRREIKTWIENHGIADAVWYFDKATGDNMNRPQFKKMQRAVFDGHVHTVVVWKLDRLSRKMRDGVNVIGNWCDKGIRVVSVTEAFDFSGMFGEMIAAFLLTLAQNEQKNRRERQKAGIAAARAEGVKWGGKKFGPHKSTKEKEKVIKQMHEEGEKIAVIARTVNLSRTTIYKILKG